MTPVGKPDCPVGRLRPPGMGPVLAWHRENLVGKIGVFAAGIGVFTIGFGIISLLKGDGLSMLGDWFIWLFIVGGAFITTRPVQFLGDVSGCRLAADPAHPVGSHQDQLHQALRADQDRRPLRPHTVSHGVEPQAGVNLGERVEQQPRRGADHLRRRHP